MAKIKVAPGQISFNDLCWNGDADIKPDATDTQKPVKKINPHVFRQFTNRQGTHIYVCDRCGMTLNEPTFNDGNYDLNCCPDAIPHANAITHNHGHGALKNG